MEKILKLAALGWDGKEDELEFLQRVYGLKVEVIPCDNIIEVIISYPGNRHLIKVKKKKIDPVRYCLRFFRTNNGEPEGPKTAFFIGGDQEWT